MTDRELEAKTAVSNIIDYKACDARRHFAFSLLQRVGTLVLTLLFVPQVLAIGTDAGSTIANTATASFEVGGIAQTPVSSTVQTVVDELIDVAVVDAIAGPVGVASPASGAVLQFTVTNNGNGTETFRIIADANISEGGFDPVLNQLYIESNGVPGLQTGPGGDTAYIPGSGDPVLAEDETITVYAESDIPTGLAQNAEGQIELRAISATIFAQAGTDDPNNPAFPVPGTAYAGAGDNGGTAVVGSSHNAGNLLLSTTATYQVSAAVVSINKSVTSVTDPFGGATVVPGSVIAYQIVVTVTGSSAAESLTVTDVLPAELAYEPGTLAVDGVAEDDDFAPAGTDGSGFDGGTSTVSVVLGNVAGGSPAVTITFSAAVR